jgi:hypothetical protein
MTCVEELNSRPQTDGESMRPFRTIIYLTFSVQPGQMGLSQNGRWIANLFPLQNGYKMVAKHPILSCFFVEP